MDMEKQPGSGLPEEEKLPVQPEPNAENKISEETAQPETTETSVSENAPGAENPADEPEVFSDATAIHTPGLGSLSEPVDSEIGPDEAAADSTRLSRLEDMDVDRIIQEIQEEATQPSPPVPGDEEVFRDDEYRDTFGEGEEFNTIFEETVLENSGRLPEIPKETAGEEEKSSKYPKKRRPRRKSGYGLLGIPHILATCIWLLIILAIGISLGRMIWVCAADVLAFGREDREVQVTITAKDDIDAIANKLKNAGLIRYPGLFKMYTDLTHSEEDLSTGTFTLNTLYDYHALVNSMTPFADSREEVKVVIPEGYTCAQIFELLEESRVCSAADLEAYAASGELSEYWFLTDVKRGDKYSLEGFLFPDTYQFYTDDEPRRVLEKMLDAFDYRFTDIMKEKYVTLNDNLAEMMANHGYDEDYIEDHLFSIHDVVIVASMIEKESANIEESYDIASVIYNRLTNAGEFPYLNIDATIYYALGGKDGALTAEDLQIDSPYNTYTQPGLIPGAICNPGSDSLYAAVDPNYTDYYYYALDPDLGTHRFFEDSYSFDEFVASVDYD